LLFLLLGLFGLAFRASLAFPQRGKASLDGKYSLLDKVKPKQTLPARIFHVRSESSPHTQRKFSIFDKRYVGDVNEKI